MSQSPVCTWGLCTWVWNVVIAHAIASNISNILSNIVSNIVSNILTGGLKFLRMTQAPVPKTTYFSIIYLSTPIVLYSVSSFNSITS